MFRTKYLAVGQNGCEPIKFGYFFTAPVNTGLPSGRDLSHNGKLGGPDDAIGFGRHKGQYGMLLLSKFPIDRDHVRRFQKFLWRTCRVPCCRRTPKRDNHSTTRAISPSPPLLEKPLGRANQHDARRHQRPAEAGRSPSTFSARTPRHPFSMARKTAMATATTTKFACSPTISIPIKSEYLVDDAGQHGGLAADAMIRNRRRSQLRSGRWRRHAAPWTNCYKNCRVNASFIPTSKGGPLVVEQHPDQFVENHGDPTRVNVRLHRRASWLPADRLRIALAWI